MRPYLLYWGLRDLDTDLSSCSVGPEQGACAPCPCMRYWWVVAHAQHGAALRQQIGHGVRGYLKSYSPLLDPAFFTGWPKSLHSKWRTSAFVPGPFPSVITVGFGVFFCNTPIGTVSYNRKYWGIFFAHTAKPISALSLQLEDVTVNRYWEELYSPPFGNAVVRGNVSSSCTMSFFHSLWQRTYA